MIEMLSYSLSVLYVYVVINRCSLTKFLSQAELVFLYKWITVASFQSCETVNHKTDLVKPSLDISDGTQKFGTAPNVPDQVLYTCYVRACLLLLLYNT